ncbi:MAG: NAD(P)H-hydrate dehydratase [Bacteroidetes bacterium]|nr:NAD(P)H-hydrate dehydratase [Bacteroidota bacterium]
MIPLYSTKQIRRIDDYAISKLGLPGIVLMENASREIFEKIMSSFNFNSIGFVCGKGNNGGDGFAAARHFVNAGYKVKVIYLGNQNEMTPDCRMNFSVLKKMEKSHSNLLIAKYKSIKTLSSLKNYDLICDALLGSGAKGKLREPFLSIVHSLNRMQKFKVAIDIPTGLDVDKGYGEDIFHSDLTITLGGFKKGLFFGDGYSYAGEIEKGRIGVSDNYLESITTNDYLIEPEDALIGLPKKAKDIHKYSAGKVLNICGSESFPGAAVLTSKAALKIGAGASILAFPKSIRNLIQKKLGEVVVQTYEDDNNGFLSEKNVDELSRKIKWADVVTIGPGISRNEKTQNAVIKVLKERNFRNIIIDADAVFALSNNRYRDINLKNSVLTPHLAEFANLIGIPVSNLKQDVLKYGRNFVNKTGAYLVLKGAPTIIFTPNGDALINSSGNPSLAKFGTGDVLTGTIAGLLSQQNDIEKAVVSAVYIHSLAADLLVSRKTEYSLMAGELLNYLPNTINFLRNSIV